MLPIGPLMIEHRLIERMIELINTELVKIRETKQVKPRFIDAAVDFLWVYADRTHHGKEEDILFRELESKKSELAKKHLQRMNELVREHIYARSEVGAVVELNQRIINGDQKAVDKLINHLQNLIKFYPNHIEKEDKDFFIPCMEYFSKKEQQAMLDEFWEFDRQMIHERYKAVVDALENEPTE